jgi:hypothetical protein
MNDAILFEQWKESVTKTSLQTGAKNRVSNFWKPYFHFDTRIKITDVDNWGDRLLSPAYVKSHPFYPLVQRHVIKKRYGDVPIQNEHGEHYTIRTRLKVKKTRPICYAAHQDSLIYSWYAHKIHHLLEKKIKALGLGEHILAYRSIEGRCNIHFAKEAFDFIRNKGECVAMAFDVKSFFDTLNHTFLKAAWCDLLGVERLPEDHYTVFKSMTQFRFLNLDKFEKSVGKKDFDERYKDGRLSHPKEFRKLIVPLLETNPHFSREKNKNKDDDNGIPQGTALSAVLSNLYMLEADKILSAFAASCGGYYRRYCDDLFLVVPVGYDLDAFKTVKKAVEDLKLILHTDKTEVRYFKANQSGVLSEDKDGNRRPVQYLGLEFDGQHIRLRSASLSRYHQRVRRSVRRAGGMAFGKRTFEYGKIFKRALFDKYTKMAKPGVRNFIRYAETAYEITKSPELRKQYLGCVELVNECVKSETARRQTQQRKRKKLINPLLPVLPLGP